MANAFLCSLEEKLGRDNKLPYLYRRYVDNTITAMPDVAGAESFLSTLNEYHPSISFTMEVTRNKKLAFLGIEITKNLTKKYGYFLFCLALSNSDNIGFLEDILMAYKENSAAVLNQEVNKIKTLYFLYRL